ncbi:hypothetical protein V6Z12_D02G134500 [Gossypium hirsutum]
MDVLLYSLKYSIYLDIMMHEFKYERTKSLSHTKAKTPFTQIISSSITFTIPSAHPKTSSC